MEDNIKDLYNALISDNKYTKDDLGDENEFRQMMSDNENVKAFHQALMSDGFYTKDDVGDEDEFVGLYGVATEPQGTVAVSAQPSMGEDGEREQMLESAYGILGNYWSGAWKPGGDKQVMAAPEKYPTWEEFREDMNDPEKAKSASDVLNAYYEELNAQAQRNRVQVPFKAKEGDLYDTIGNIQSMLQYKKYYDMDDKQKQFIIRQQGYGKREMFDNKGNNIGYAYKLSPDKYDYWYMDEKEISLNRSQRHGRRRLLAIWLIQTT